MSWFESIFWKAAWVMSWIEPVPGKYTWVVSWIDSFTDAATWVLSWIKHYCNRKICRANGFTLKNVFLVHIKSNKLTWVQLGVESRVDSESYIFVLNHEFNGISSWKNTRVTSWISSFSGKAAWVISWIDLKLSQSELIRFIWSWVVPKSDRCLCLVCGDIRP